MVGHRARERHPPSGPEYSGGPCMRDPHAGFPPGAALEQRCGVASVWHGGCGAVEGKIPHCSCLQRTSLIFRMRSVRCMSWYDSGRVNENWVHGRAAGGLWFAIARAGHAKPLHGMVVGQRHRAREQRFIDGDLVAVRKIVQPILLGVVIHRVHAGSGVR